MFCRSCLADFPHHFIIEGSASSRWRGKSFDAEEAEGLLGLALSRELGVSIKDPAGFERFALAFSIRTLRESVEENPATPIPAGEGERWWFHIGVRDAAGPRETAARFEEPARAAVAKARNFRDARILP